MLTKRNLVVGMISFAKGGRENVSVERDMLYVLPKSHSSVGAVEKNVLLMSSATARLLAREIGRSDFM